MRVSGSGARRATGLRGTSGVGSPGAAPFGSRPAAISSRCSAAALSAGGNIGVVAVENVKIWHGFNAAVTAVEPRRAAPA